MELLDKALYCNTFGLRESNSWESSTHGIHLHSVLNRVERSRVLRYVGSVVHPSSVKINRVENPYLWGRYVLRYEEMKADPISCNVTEQIMVHATTKFNARRIAEENFDWRLVNRSRFGKGVSFAKDPSYAQFRATHSDSYIVAGVLIANHKPGTWGQEIPPEGYDTTTGYTKDVCIKYYDNDFYPYYIVDT